MEIRLYELLGTARQTGIAFGRGWNGILIILSERLDSRDFRKRELKGAYEGFSDYTYDGTKAKDVKTYLESVLHHGKIRGCAVLLEEADVFLEQCSLEDMQRIAIVLLFLRVLEYYEGILIQTSNRVGTFDEAFKSQIQLARHYQVLGAYQRLRILGNSLNRLVSFGDDDRVDVADLRDHMEDLKE